MKVTIKLPQRLGRWLFGDAKSRPADELPRLLRALTEPAAKGDPALRATLSSRALALLPRETEQDLWAALQTELASGLVERSDGDHDRNVEAAIAANQLALEVFTAQRTPMEWANTMAGLGRAYRERSTGDRADNLEHALEAYQRALEVTDKESMPGRWGTFTANLAEVYVERVRGDHAENVERAIAACHDALEALADDRYRGQRAEILANLGTAFCIRIRGGPGDNLEHAISAYEQALEVLTPEARPVAWGIATTYLGNAYRDRVRGDRAENLERAIECYREALRVRTRETMPRQWAATMGDLAIAYRDRVTGDRGENLEHAREAIEATLGAVARSVDPGRWAGLQVDLASVYRQRLRGERGENVERAIAASRAALDAVTREAQPDTWANAMGSLGNSYVLRETGSRAENIEQAIVAYEDALDVLTPESKPREWATTLAELATAYRYRLRGERSENLDLAIESCAAALGVFTREDTPLEWAATLTTLGAAYLYRPRGSRRENLERAIAALEGAREIFTRTEWPVRWAETMNGLASALMFRLEGSPRENRERALGFYESALAVFTEDGMPLRWAEIRDNLGTAYQLRLDGDPAENLERAIESYELALRVRTRRTVPREWAQTLNNLGLAYGRRQRGSRADNVARAHDLLTQALEVRTRDGMVAEHRTTQRNLGDLFFADRRWTDASRAYDAALAAGEDLYLSSATPAAREAELRETVQLPANAAYSLARQGRLREAVTTLEHSRTRALGEAIARGEAVSQRAAPADQEAFLAARARIGALEAEARSEGEPGSRDFLAVTPDLRAAREELAAIADRIRGVDPDFMPARLDFGAIARAAAVAEVPLVYLFTTAHGSAALVVPPATRAETELDDEHVVWLDGFSAGDLSSILYDPPDSSVSDAPRYLRSVVWEHVSSLSTILDEISPQLDAAVMAPLAARLQRMGFARAALVLTGTLTLLPLHATGSPAAPEIVWSLAPSARAIRAAHAAMAKRAGRSRSLVAVANPLPNPAPLAFARLEVRTIEPLFPDGERRTLYEGEASRGRIQAALPGATHVHFACHGVFDLDRPLESALRLSGGETLTLRDVLDGDFDLASARLVVLSACQTGVTEFENVPDEALGFPVGFLHAGVPGVISSLWPVDDISTAALLACVYQNLVEGVAAGAALHRAQQWLRTATARDLRLEYLWEQHSRDASDPDVRRDAYRRARYYRARPDDRPFEHRFFWAAFTFTGVG